MKVTFNVVYTPGTIRTLLPLAFSLLRDRGVSLRLVMNSCPPGEVEYAHAAARAEPRTSVHDLEVSRPLEHGPALNRLFEAFKDPVFAMADSDVFATGPFLADVGLRPGEAGSFAAPPVWITREEQILSEGAQAVGGRVRELRDGTVVGGTYIAMYDRAAVAPLVRAAPRGWGQHFRMTLPRETNRKLDEHGFGFRLFDTGRLLNLQLLTEGRTLVNRDSPRLHHIGGISLIGFEGARKTMRDALRLAISRNEPEPRVAHVVNGLIRRYHARLGLDPGRPRVLARRQVVRAHFDAALTALAAGAEPPEPPVTGEPDVDAQVRDASAALARIYPEELARTP